MSTTIGILAHVDAGKTTLSEQILFRAGVLRAPGRVDHRDTYLDASQVERDRGITIFSGQAPFTLRGEPFYLIDTPGHTDFSGEMERALSVLDCALLVISCAEGVQAHTETVWRLLRRRDIPTIIFLNKTDRAGADPVRVLAEIQERLGVRAADFSGFSGGAMDVPLAERIAENDDALLCAYLDTGYDPARWLEAARRQFADCRLFPALRGAALAGEGVAALLDVLAALAPRAQGDSSAPFYGQVYQVRRDARNGRVVLLKVLSGTLRPKDAVACLPRGGGDPVPEKINTLRAYSGTKAAALASAGPGDLCAVTGLLLPMPGDRIGFGPALGRAPESVPVLAAKVFFDGVPARAALERLRELEDEEPLLGVAWNEALQEISVRVMGAVQLEILADQARERFGLELSFGECQVLYQETIAAPVTGCGHFEPLRHYAEVHLRLSPGPRGSGVVFDSACPCDDLAQSWQNLIRSHILEKTHRGVLIGAPLTDVHVTLLAGRAHLKHTEGGDFREAAYRALRCGLMRASSVLLEPFYAFEARAGSDCAGRLLADFQRMEAAFSAPEQSGGGILLRGLAPAAALMGYPERFAALTRGRGSLRLSFDGYEPCRRADEIISRAGYAPERDTDNPPDSVFCSHGAGFTVKWYDAPGYMHLHPAAETG